MSEHGGWREMINNKIREEMEQTGKSFSVTEIIAEMAVNAHEAKEQFELEGDTENAEIQGGILESLGREHMVGVSRAYLAEIRKDED